MKKELLKLIKESDEGYYSNLNEMSENVIRLKEAIAVIKCYEEIIKTKRRT